MSVAEQTGEARPSERAAMRRLGLRRLKRNGLTIERRKVGEAFAYFAGAREIRGAARVKRFNALAVPPAYSEVRFAADPDAHIQAVGRDAAGRLQYRYHPRWVALREREKSRHLLSLVDALPRVRKAIADALAGGEPTREFTLAALIELVSLTAIRPGNEEYAKRNGSRGAATLLKSHVRIFGDDVTLVFRGKGGKDVRKQVTAPRLARAIGVLRSLPGPRLFQYRDEPGLVRSVTVHQANAHLRGIAQAEISLKDFRTLCASASALDVLAREVPAGSARARQKQILAAVREASALLANTPTVCRKSYVHEAIVTAFENGALEKFAATLKRCRTERGREKVLAAIVSTAV